MKTFTKMFVLLAAALFLVAACGDEEPPADADGETEATTDAGGGDCATETTTTDSGLKYRDIECGDGDEAAKGDTVEVHYVGTLEDGTKFDASRDHGSTFEFQLGAGQVIAGWDEGLVGMKVGGVRELTIPPDLGYGAAGAPPAIPPNSVLIFEVELVGIT